MKNRSQPEIMQYMEARARDEGMKHDLTEDWYSAALKMGIRSFFGVEVTSDGRVLTDEQNPSFFEKWKGRRQRRRDGGGAWPSGASVRPSRRALCNPTTPGSQRRVCR
jgi:hypothetical protein